jgi:hypothetical protein
MWMMTWQAFSARPYNAESKCSNPASADDLGEPTAASLGAICPKQCVADAIEDTRKFIDCLLGDLADLDYPTRGNEGLLYKALDVAVVGRCRLTA